MKSVSWYAAFAAWLRLQSQENDAVQAEGTLETLRRFRWVVCVMVPVHLGLGVFLGQYAESAAQPSVQSWAQTIAQAHWVALVLLVLSGLASQYCLRQARATTGAVALQIAIGAGYVYLGAYFSIVDLSAGEGAGLSSLMFVCILLGVMSLMRPAISVPLYACTYLVFASMLRQASIPVSQSSLHILAFLTPLLALLTSLIVWRQYANGVKLQRQLSVSNQALVARQGELAYLASHDPLTGLVNRREFMRMAQIELAHSVSAAAPMHLVMVDLDHFKRVNDLHGHPVGDAMLQHVAGLLTRGLRGSDTVARLGGEEFIVLLPNTTPQSACDVAEKLRLLLRAHPLWMTDPSLSLAVTASLGVSGISAGQNMALDTIYAAADRALYDAKQRGRNRVCYAPPDGVGQAVPSQEVSDVPAMDAQAAVVPPG